MVTTNKKVEMRVNHLCGNVFALVNSFQKNARQQGWTSKEINSVIIECFRANDKEEMIGIIVEKTKVPQEVKR